jgi:hypothetical protein
MTYNEIIIEIQRLDPAEQLSIAETVLHLLREKVPQFALPAPLVTNEQLAQAAEAARIHYLTDSELTVFTALDSEDFYA